MHECRTPSPPPLLAARLPTGYRSVGPVPSQQVVFGDPVLAVSHREPVTIPAYYEDAWCECCGGEITGPLVPERVEMQTTWQTLCCPLVPWYGPSERPNSSRVLSDGSTRATSTVTFEGDIEGDTTGSNNG